MNDEPEGWQAYRLLGEEVLDHAIYTLDREGRISTWNAGAQRMKQYSEAEILGSPVSRFYRAVDVAAGLPDRTLGTALNEGRYEGEGWRVRADGTEFWARVIVRALRNSSGEVTGFAKITRDLTERRAAQQALRSSDDQFRLLVQSVTDYAIYKLGLDGTVSSWNAGAERIKQYGASEIIGRSFRDFYLPDEQARGEPEKNLAIAAHVGRFASEGWRLRKDGSQFWASVVIDAMRDDAGRVIGFAKITRDITESREATLALQDARERLFLAQKIETIGQLTGGVAHDFNNLLMAIMGNIEIAVRRVGTDSPAAPMLRNAMRGAERGASLTQRLLAFARRQELAPSVVDVPALLQGMRGLLDSSVGAGVSVELPATQGSMRTMVDPHQLELAVLNLVVNARDAMPDGGLITVRADERVGGDKAAPTGAWVCLSVTDDGAGMDAATLARATEPFFTTKGVGKGTGLGLSMIDGLAEQSEGRFVLSSEIGRGTRAEIWLPAWEGADTLGAAAPRAGAVGDSGALLVLAVDDDELILTVTTAMLEELGHLVIGVSSGEEALVVIGSGRPIDLVITDQMMPGMRGTELAQALRASGSVVPVLLASGFAEVGAEEDGGLPRLSKPFQIEQLERAIRAAAVAERT